MRQIQRLIRLAFIALFLVSSGAWAYSRKPYVIMVGGGSASGKTFIAKRIVEALGERAILLSADNYFAPEKQPKEFYLHGSINYDHPSAVDLKKLAQHLMYLKSGFPVSIEEYTFGRPVETPHILTYQPAEFIVVEGIFALYPDLAEHSDFRVFVDVDTDIRLQRRIERDIKERGISEDEVRKYFSEVVEPMHQKYIQPSALYADIVVTSPTDRNKVAEIVRAVTNLAQQNRATKYNVLKQTYDDVLADIFHAPPPNRDFRIFSFADMHPTQTEIGFNRLAVKSFVVNNLVRESSLAFDLPSRLKEFLLANPIPVVERNGQYFAVDHHHLAMALSLKGIEYFLVEVMPPDFKVDPWRLELINAPDTRATWQDLKNNPYRSLASLVMELGHIKKTGKPHQEFDWAAELKTEFEQRLQYPVSEEVLQDPDRQFAAVQQAIVFARSPRAQHLEGYLSAGTVVACADALRSAGLVNPPR